MKENLIYLIFASFAASVAFAQEQGSGEVASGEIDAVRIDENPVLTDTELTIVAGSDGKAIFAWEQTSGTFEYSATNGTLNIKNGDIEVGNSWSSFTDQTLNVNFLGSGNTIIVESGKSLNLQAVGGSNTGNIFTSKIESSDSDAVNTLSVDTINIAGGANYSGESSSTSQSIMLFNGNTRLQSTTDTEAGTNRYFTTINFNNTGANGGVSKLVVRNSNNVLNINELNMNYGYWYDVSNVTNMPKAIFDIGGSGNDVHVRWVNINTAQKDASAIVRVGAGNTFTVGYNGETWSGLSVNMASGLNFKEVYNPSTGELENGSMFIFEASSDDGFATSSKLVLDSYGWLGSSINAFIVLDLTDAFPDLLKDWMQVVTIVESVNGSAIEWGEDTAFFIQIGSKVLGVGESWGNITFDSVDTDNNQVNIYFTVPEPASCALIFGALFLLIALRRRS